MAIGRPLKYKKIYCEQIIAFMKHGATFVEFASHIGVSRDTILDWRKKYPDFSGACDIACTNAQAYYESLGRAAMFGKGPVDSKTGKQMPVNFQNWSFTVSRRWKDWRDRSAIEHSGIIEPPKSKEPTDEQLDEKVKALLEKKRIYEQK